MNDNPSTNPGFTAAASVPAKSLFGFVFKLCAAGFIGLTVIALLLPSASRGREAARRTQCKNNLKQIALALSNYESIYRELPPAYTVNEHGQPLHSWRTLILPFLDQQSLYETIDLSKPWDDPANAKARSANVYTYCCPSMSRPAGHTTYRAVLTANGCIQPIGSDHSSLKSSSKSDTWMVMEVPPEQSMHWMAPVDADEQLIFSINPKTNTAHIGGTHVVSADGSVRFESSQLTVEARRAHMGIAKATN